MSTETDLPTLVRNSSARLARAAIWIGGSALFGSLALVLWNRRALKSMREAAKAPDEPFPISGDDIY
jgi:hypothetical protein